MFLYIFVLFLRVIFSPLILIWPFISVIVSFSLDLVDGDFAAPVVTKAQYQLIDKTVDYWVYIFEMVYSWIYLPSFKWFLLALFIWRTIGTLIFYITSKRKLFIIFGNYFENAFFIFFFAKIFPNLRFLVENRVALVVSLIAVFSIKAFQEWFIHIADLSVREDIFKNKRSWKKT